MNNPRNGEEKQAWFRSNRFYKLQDKWYFTTREGIDFGPFLTREEAQQELAGFIEELPA